MLIIQYENIKATFSQDRWRSKDKVLEKLLNEHKPRDEELSISNMYLEDKKNSLTGIDVLAFKNIAFLKPKLIKHVPEPIPEEREGVVY